VKTLSQIGKSGTAKNMLKNQPVKQEIYIKTGSMNGIKTYAGYIINKKGELISFCFMANNFECSQNKISQKLEQILLMIIEQ
jgi:D-alanyl-D-alanine carboxypeptidase/D-alanyl-D-alanine-endopeptidase (penicillin-binding protein 4)